MNSPDKDKLEKTEPATSSAEDYADVEPASAVKADLVAEADPGGSTAPGTDDVKAAGEESVEADATHDETTAEDAASDDPDTEWPPRELAGRQEAGESDIAIPKSDGCRNEADVATLFDDRTDQSADDGVAGQAETSEPDATGPARRSSETEDTAALDSSPTESRQLAPPDEPSSSEQPSPSQRDPAAIRAELDKQRAAVVEMLFAAERPPRSKSDAAVERYTAAVSAAQTARVLDGNETELLLVEVRKRHEQHLTEERQSVESHQGDAKQRIESYDELFSELDRLADAIASELAKLNVEDEPFTQAPEELQGKLTNHRKGVEIIHRMVARTIDRRQDFTEQGPPALHEVFEPTPVEAAVSAELLRQWSDTFHELRDQNYHAIKDTEKYVGKCRDAAVSAVKSFASAVDGIDSGRDGEKQLRDVLEAFQEEHGALIDSWLAVYDRLIEPLDAFFEATGVRPETVEHGTPFDPERMEPIGTVEHPEMDDEAVAAVARRGFSLDGDLVRPIEVEVVKNPS